MKKHKKKIIFGTFIIGFLFGFYYIYQRFSVITGYAAKNMCSCVFLAHRDEHFTMQDELQFSFIKYANVAVDYEAQKVTATMFGLGSKTAYYHPQKGCALLEKYEVEAFMKNVPGVIQSPGHSRILEIDSTNEAIDFSKLYSLLDNQFVNIDTDKPMGTRAILVLHDGKIIAEKYAKDFDTSSLHLGWSMAKSVFSALIGIAIKDGKISSIDAVNLFSEWNDKRKEVSLKNLLQMNSGLEWEENYANLSGVTRMLYKSGDMVFFAKNSGFEAEIGSHFEYSSGSSNLLSGYLRSRFENYESYFNFPYERLFERIGASSFRLETDAYGNFVASSYAWATARDWAKFGQLYIDSGSCGNEILFDKEWFQFSKQPAVGSNGSYAAQFWLPTSSEYPDAPNDMFFADGFQGQRIFIIPSKRLVIVRMGVSRFEQPDYNALVKNVVACIND